jgi:hypothetical protein
MKTVLRRKDNTSIFCPSLNHSHFPFTVKMKVIELMVAGTLISIGLFIMLSTQ